MPRLPLNYNMEQFLNHCRMTKPPYKCPIAICGRVYKSFPGIQNHLNLFDHDNPPAAAPKQDEIPKELEPPAIPLSTDLRSVDYEFEGKTINVNVYDRIKIFSKEEYEASLPPQIEEPPAEDVAKINNVKVNTPKSTPKTPKNRNNDKGVDVQRYTIEDKKSQKLPEAAFSIIPDYYANLPDVPKRTDEYFRFVEKTPEELDKEVEYDMDEEDTKWLELINKNREEYGQHPVSMEIFELLMDRLEKESFFQAQSTGRDPGIPVDEDAVCCICMDGECQNSNVILFCDMCNLAVHQECYGVPYIPEGQWLCRRCLQSPSRAVQCVLCPNRGGAFKQTDDNRWGHVVCAMWIPEVCFANTVFLEPIDSIGRIQHARWKLTCYICMQRAVGACIQCNKVNCYTAFHVTCAQQAGLHMKIDAVRETSDNGTSVTVRKAAYCDMHTPADSDAKPQVEEIMDSAKKAAAKAASRQKMKKARKILAEKRSATPMVSVPMVPPERIQDLAKLSNIEGKSRFIRRLLAYWQLKRHYRNGVPLLRRLTTSYPRRAAPSTGQKQEKEKKVMKKKSGKGKMSKLTKPHQRIRQDLEKTRLLCELIRKREKTKKEYLSVRMDETMLTLAPFVHIILKKIDQIQELDIMQIFAEPVDFDEVPDYLDVVKHPIDLSTIRQKAKAFQYQQVDQLEADFNLMIDNCLTYNSKDTVFYRAAVKLRDPGLSVLRQFRREVESTGFDPLTGLLLRDRPILRPEISEQSLIKEIDEISGKDLENGESLEDRQKILLYLLDKSSIIKHPVTRNNRVKLVRKELTNVRRKQTMEQNEGRAQSVSSSEDRENSDQEESSGADDEAEPGEPAKPPSPKNVEAETNKEPAVPKKTIKGRTMQKKIDSFFPVVSSPSSKPKPVEVEEPPKPSVPESQSSSPIPPSLPKKRGRKPKISKTSPKHNKEEDVDETVEEETSKDKTEAETKSKEDVVQEPSSPSGVNRRTSVLFNKKTPPPSKTNKSEENDVNSIKSSKESTVVDLTENGSIKKESFKVYRQPGDIAQETDEDASQSESTASDSSGTEVDSDSDEVSSSASDSNECRADDIPLEPLDLVWAKCRGYPWYPALIINPKMPRTGYYHNKVPIPVPPDEVLAHASNYDIPMYLILFFDQKRTWQWLPRNKLEPLGVNSTLDKAKLVESRKPTERKAVKKAYEKAIFHRCKVTGEKTGLSGESDNEAEI